MTGVSTRKGSALLIVIGMLAFMVVSAVGFAVFMRTSRAPSGYLRRAVSSSFLLKSALANAIARLDGEFTPLRLCPGQEGYSDDSSSGRIEGVYDDPYPGVVSGVGDIRENGDYWDHRVFTPFGPVAAVRGDEDDAIAPVSTMTLEALAYLPPAIVNEVRVYSRRTYTARWRNLAYDAGRYAFTAVNVSDFFDINKLAADTNRSSAAGNRISLSPLLDREASSIQSIFDKVRNSGSVSDFISMADFNVVAGKGSEYAPFMNFIGTTGEQFYDQSDTSLKNLLFITDTWFPPTNRVEGGSAASYSKEVYDLARGGQYQPFSSYDSIHGFLDFFKKGGAANTKVGQLLSYNLGGAGMAALYDYLDDDAVPISLALPTVETVPMICGIGLAGGVAAQFEVKSVEGFEYELPNPSDEESPYRCTRTIERIDFKGLDGALKYAGVAIFPFKHINGNTYRGDDGASPSSYKVEALVGAFFAPDDLRCRTADVSSYLRPTQDDWNNPAARNGICWYKGDTASLSFKDNLGVNGDDNALYEFNGDIDLAEMEIPIYHHITDVESSGGLEALDFTTLDGIDEARDGKKRFTYYNSLGESDDCDNAYKNNINPENKLFRSGEINSEEERMNRQRQIDLGTALPGSYRLYVAIWTRVIKGNEVVDYCPAVFLDDAEYLDGSSIPTDGDILDEFRGLCGPGAPLLDFKTDMQLDMKRETLEPIATEGQRPVQFIDWKSLYAVDPRYNFAPEDWFGVDEPQATKQGWKTHVADSVFGQGGRDPDYYMFTSDQEYLQSIGELAFLPYTQDLGMDVTNPMDGQFADVGRYSGENNFAGRSPGDMGGFANGKYMWRTYTPIDHNGSGYDPIYDLTKSGVHYDVVSGTGGFKVNPFSDDERVIMAALKGTPYDYYAASTNLDLGLGITTYNGQKQYTFSDSSAAAPMTEEELQDMSRAFVASMHSAGANASWESVFDSMQWYDGKSLDQQLQIFGIDEELEHPLHGVDRKYLYSFWRECFQNRQQLFLVFLRAEPLTVGGTSGEALASSQLGARGVALVWRDPVSTPRDNNGESGGALTRAGTVTKDSFSERQKTRGPNRTRVLFYHQFD